jgi:hypothetical protein
MGYHWIYHHFITNKSCWGIWGLTRKTGFIRIYQWYSQHGDICWIRFIIMGKYTNQGIIRGLYLGSIQLMVFTLVGPRGGQQRRRVPSRPRNHHTVPADMPSSATAVVSLFSTGHRSYPKSTSPDSFPLQNGINEHVSKLKTQPRHRLGSCFIPGRILCWVNRLSMFWSVRSASMGLWPAAAPWEPFASKEQRLQSRPRREKGLVERMFKGRM